jgi:predicted nucleotidyltransferase
MKDEIKLVGEPRIPLDMEKIKAFCQKWKIVEFSLFGSVLTDDFRPDSDVDVMVEFAPDTKITFFDLTDIEDELEQLLVHRVDIVTKRSIVNSENYLMRRSILSNTRTLYAA